MATCPSCGIEKGSSAEPCTRCGSAEPIRPGLELDLPLRRAAKSAVSAKRPEVEVPIELAIDPRTFVRPMTALPRTPGGVTRSGLVGGDVHDVSFDAHLLAEYGEPPRHWALAPLYAWRVLQRRRHLRQSLEGRRREAARTAVELEDALVAFAQRTHSIAEGAQAYGPLLDEWRRAEETLRARDAILAAEQDAQTGRLASVDAELAKLETELAQVLGEERTLAAEATSAEGALGRAEAQLKRAEAELRSRQRLPDRTSG